jgi:Predicted AAA-ATPase
MFSAKLPIGIQDFETIISDGYSYIDKTKWIFQLIDQGKSYFLSRPRRFGKSLLISTFAALFSGKRHLFKNLWIDSSNYDWKEYPILRLDMSGINNQTP